MPYWFDGNNLMGQSVESALEDRTSRRAFLQLLSRYVRSGGGRFVVFFDGDDPDRTIPPRGIQIRFSAPESADDAILRSLSGSSKPREVTVVTNDRKLLVRCHDSGARTMTWREFTQKRRLSFEASPREPFKDKDLKVEDWAEYFGFDPNELE